MVKGLQGEPGQPGGVLACAKHFLGDGGTSQGRTRATPSVPRRAARHPSAGLRSGGQGGCRIDHGSFSRWNGAPMHANKHLITDVLKGELHSKVSW